MGLLYDRTISVTRATAQTGAGLQGYGGDILDNETPVANGIPAAIHAKRVGRAARPNLPLDGTTAEWAILARLAPGFDPMLIQDRDFVTDDLGRRFQVVSSHETVFGFELRCLRMEA
jgi:hypothetical protein